ncbi:Solute carrier 2 (Facilitated glucose transporter) member 8 [Blomia tropicalis]|nr:Solute carrier 2 (Facilitated glucose transporter) member 8 [Blomia tropicalis]
MADTTLLIEDQHHRRAKYILPILSAWVGSFSLGTVLGYSSPALPSFDEPGSHIQLDGFLKSFFVSLMALGAVLGCICAGFLNESVGRKGTLIFTSLPFISGWVLMACAGNLDSVAALMIGRFLTGLCCGLVSLTAPVYISETCDPDKRGFFGSGFQLSVTFGIVITYVIGKYLNWADLALLLTLFPFLFLITILWMPESPAWLLKKGRISEATEANLFLYGAEGSRRVAVDVSIPTIDSDSEGSEDGSFAVLRQIRLFRHVQYYKPMLISIALMFFQQFCGVNAIITSMSSIFQKSNFQMISASDSSIIVGFIQVFATLIACFLSDKFGRKMLTIMSSTGTAISLIPLAIFDYISTIKNSPEFNHTYGWIPIVSVIVFIIFFSLGLGPIPWLIMGELIPFRAKGISTLIAASFNWFCAFIIIVTFLNYINSYYIYIIFCMVSITSAIFTLIYLPETKGKSFHELELLFTPNVPQ